ncbi:hypothetical protein B0H15DRAFT_947507 [Mycena belliarum]|uniref:Zn(2)-C6 fungal-type domain-containing protein n=1 Tax=Mycena belliarum TaxID=1033014 RepID=A0AAD6U8R2_9AGAR|nr:hypothetical protein B0H15DRAFT_947507 [Mycena belliae]
MSYYPTNNAPISYPYSPPPTPRAPHQQRTPLACLSCRKHNIKCRPPDNSARMPCERCVARGLLCQYAPSSLADSGPGAGSQKEPTHYAPAPAPASLPSTRPPPHGQRPRYAGQALPDLSLSAGSVSAADPIPQYSASHEHRSAVPPQPPHQNYAHGVASGPMMNAPSNSGYHAMASFPGSGQQYAPSSRPSPRADYMQEQFYQR